MKKFTKVLAVVMVCVLALNLSVTAFATDNTDLRDEICKLCCQQSAMYGVELTNDEISTLNEEIEDFAIKYASDNQCNVDEAYVAILAEFQSETNTYDNVDANENIDSGVSVCGSSGKGKVQLPTSKKGNIFFCDNKWAWNHVGLYTANDRIIEAMPDYGVHEVSITDSTAKQETTGESHDQSRILSVNKATDDDKQKAVTWAMNQIGKNISTIF